jgi:predicted AAA+ superfamily ATPase
MVDDLDRRISRALSEKLTESQQGPIPEGTERSVHGTVIFPGKATAVIGMRRAGKTTFLHQVRRERLAAGRPRGGLPYINFEDERLSGIEVRHLTLLLEEFYRRQPKLRGREVVTWCFDEIQVIPGWERFVRRLLDSEKVEVFLSGSSAALLSREVATSMRGRGWEVIIHPFSFAEALRHGGVALPKDPRHVTAAQRSSMEHALLAYLEVGGFPEVQSISLADRDEILTRYVDVVMLRDIMERHGVANLTGLHWLVRHLLGNPGGSFSVEKFCARLRNMGVAISRDTLHAMLGYVEDCFLIRTTWVESASARRRMVNPRKIHPVDPALIAIFDQTGRANRGHALETVVRVELERRKKQATYVKTREGFEIDFLARSAGARPALIQVAAELDDVATLDREIRGLLAARGEHPKATLHMVTLTPERAGGVPPEITVHPAWRWLLEEEEG